MRARSISHAGTAALIALLAWGGVAAALATQHVWNLQPCPWCIIQRLAYLIVGFFAILSLLATQSSLWARAPLLLAALAAIVGLGTAMYQHFVAAQTGSCAFTAADRFLSATGLDELAPSVFKATAACDEANAPMLGIPYSLWSAALAILLLGLTFYALRRAGVRT
ncbi:MAG TPA: disulfide bond formation protein B [Lautropia sp.]|nr:disulfide bond formation protein B [Lautropia sp.]